MPLTCHPTHELLQHDQRYAPQAYEFLRDAMEYAVQVLNMGRVRPTVPVHKGAAALASSLDDPLAPAIKRERRRNRLEPARLKSPLDEEEGEHRHLSGQELCEAIRRLALERFGYLARCVFKSWGLNSSGDFGEMVFTLIRLGRMRRTEDDRRQDFDKAFDFDADLRAAFEFEPLNSSE